MRLFVALFGVLAAVLWSNSYGFAQPGAPIVYEAPAQNLPAGRDGETFSAILPSGRLVKPEGRSVVVGTNATSVALSPDGKFAFVAGAMLSVVDVESMQVVAQVGAPPLHPYTGIIAVSDPADASRTLVLAAAGSADAVYFLRFSGSTLRLEPTTSLPLTGFPTALSAALDGKTAYAAQSLENTVTAIDVGRRRVRTTRSVGFSPTATAVTTRAILVCNEGLMDYGRLANPAAQPAFQTPPANIDRASSLTQIGLDSSGNLLAVAQDPDAALPMDRPPDGLRIVGGAHPSAAVVTPDGNYAFVAMANVDRIAVVSLTGAAHVVTGLDLRLFPKGPFGTQPNALALSRDGKRLYVALAGLDAIAVLDSSEPLRLRRLGLIPTGDYPLALALSVDDRSLYVANAKGFGPLELTVPSTLERVDLNELGLVHDTYTTLGAVRVARSSTRGPLVPAIGSGRGSNRIKHVVLVLEEDKTFDSVLGDLEDASGRRHGNGDPTLSAFGVEITPNLHALARTYGLADNFYADARTLVLGHEIALGGIASEYAQKRELSGALFRQVPDDYARYGYIFNTLALHRAAYRDYGELLLLRGYVASQSPDPSDRFAPTSDLGGTYALDVPATAALLDHVDEIYPGWNPRIRDERRAREFVRDYDALVTAHHAPRFAVLWLPNTGGKNREAVADGDRALGVVVSHLTRSPIWKDVAVFVMPADAGSEKDHVSSQRSFALVVSPYAKRAYVSHRHLSTVSVLKTQEELLGLPPLSLGDLLATDMADFFSGKADFTPYTARPVPAQTE